MFRNYGLSIWNKLAKWVIFLFNQSVFWAGMNIQCYYNICSNGLHELKHLNRFLIRTSIKKTFMIRWEYSIQASDRVYWIYLVKLNCTSISIQNILSRIRLSLPMRNTQCIYYFDRASITFSEQCIGSKYHETNVDFFDETFLCSS